MERGEDNTNSNNDGLPLLGEEALNTNVSNRYNTNSSNMNYNELHLDYSYQDIKVIVIEPFDL